MKKLLLSLLILTFTSLTVFADGKQEALDFFNSYVSAANTYSDSVGEMYSPSAKIIREDLSARIMRIAGIVLNIAIKSPTPSMSPMVSAVNPR